MSGIPCETVENDSSETSAPGEAMASCTILLDISFLSFSRAWLSEVSSRLGGRRMGRNCRDSRGNGIEEAPLGLDARLELVPALGLLEANSSSGVLMPIPTSYPTSPAIRASSGLAGVSRNPAIRTRGLNAPSLESWSGGETERGGDCWTSEVRL